MISGDDGYLTKNRLFMNQREYFVHIMTNTWHTVLYTGMTGRGIRRFQEHHDRTAPSFTERYHVHKVVFVQAFSSPIEAAVAEKRIKGWTRKKKIAPIETLNPKWTDLINGDTSRSLPR